MKSEVADRLFSSTWFVEVNWRKELEKGNRRARNELGSGVLNEEAALIEDEMKAGGIMKTSKRKKITNSHSTSTQFLEATSGNQTKS